MMGGARGRVLVGGKEIGFGTRAGCGIGWMDA